MTPTLSNSALAPTYQRADLNFTQGDGVWLYDAAGQKYLDMLAGIAVNALGHQHPAILQAITTAMQAPIHVSNLYYNEPAEKLARHLVRLSFADAVFLCNSGTEAVEGALKFARKRKPGGPIVACRGAFHGRTMGALSVTWNPKYREPFEPLVPGIQWADFNDLAIDIPDDTCAVMVEPIQGEGGVVPATPEFLARLRQRCDATDATLIFDEVQCGLGRTGTLWAYQHSGVVPDILTLAKPLGGGFPIGAILMREGVANALAYGDHGTTFGGGPFICTVAQALLDTVTAPGFMDHVVNIGQLLYSGLQALQQRCPAIVSVRGRGLMWGVQLAATVPVESVVAQGHKLGLILGQSAGNTLRLLPPLVIEAAHVELALQLLEDALACQP